MHSCPYKILYDDIGALLKLVIIELKNGSYHNIYIIFSCSLSQGLIFFISH
jgi:hypothetical protein